jgi:hypothetical protein
LDLDPARFFQSGDGDANAIPLGEADMIEIQCTGDRHPVVLGEHHFRWNSADCPRRWNNYEFVQALHNELAREQEDGTSLVVYQRISPRCTELVPPLRFPGQRLTLRRELFCTGRRCTVCQRSRLLRRSCSKRELGQLDALFVRQLENQPSTLGFAERRVPNSASRRGKIRARAD